MGSPAASPLLQESFWRPTHGKADEVSAAQRVWSALPQGHAIEISGASGKLSFVAGMLALAQSEGEPSVWLTHEEAPVFFPPDLLALGVDLEALVVLRIPSRFGPHAIVKACEVVLRSGAFGVLVLDLSDRIPAQALSWQARLLGLTRLHRSRLVFLTSSDASAPSIGPSISLRIETRCVWNEEGDIELSFEVLKNRLGDVVPRSLLSESRMAPSGARKGQSL